MSPTRSARTSTVTLERQHASVVSAQNMWFTLASQSAACPVLPALVVRPSRPAGTPSRLRRPTCDAAFFFSEDHGEANKEEEQIGLPALLKSTCSLQARRRWLLRTAVYWRLWICPCFCCLSPSFRYSCFLVCFFRIGSWWTAGRIEVKRLHSLGHVGVKP